MKKLILIFIFLISIPFAIADWFYNSESVIAKVDIYSYAEVVQTTPSGYIKTAAINMTFFPKQTDTQELLRFDTKPQAELTDKTLKFEWEMPEGKIDFRVNADIKAINTIKQIRRKIDFPIKELPEEILIYTKSSETIDSNDEDIIKIANELVKGEDDLYIAVFKIAEWTKDNINYNLSTLTAEVSQKASWVLQNRQGVCDELTSLFIALLRAVGIPARFVSGISYTNSELFPEKWGPHGWAEVYFPNYGWVPFDVTYGEFGWVDPTHLKFKDSIDSDEPSTYYQWTGVNADLSTRKLDIKTDLIDTIGYYKTPLRIEVFSLKKAISFGSYNLVEATVENLNDFYYATEIYLVKPKEVKILGSELKSILLLPNEKKKVFWILKLDDNLDRRYSYTFPLIISTMNNISAETSFTSSVRERDVSFEEVQQIAKLLEEEEAKQYSGNVLLDCKIGKEEFYEYEDVKVYCNAKNTGNILLDNVDVCMESKCTKTTLGISQTKNVEFEIDKSKIGIRENQVTLRNELVSKALPLSFKVNDAPKIEIESLEFPANLSYNDEITVSFILAKKSQSIPKNIDVVFTQNGIKKEWNIDDLKENRKFVLNFAANQLEYGKNSYKINVDYFDGLNKQYITNKEFSIELANVTLFQRVLLWVNNFENISLKTLAIILGVVAVAFVGLIVWIFRRR